jgi:hypothetical protein
VTSNNWPGTKAGSKELSGDSSSYGGWQTLLGHSSQGGLLVNLGFQSVDTLGRAIRDIKFSTYFF